MKKILLIFLFSISFLSAEINEYLSDVYFTRSSAPAVEPISD